MRTPLRGVVTTATTGHIIHSTEPLSGNSLRSRSRYQVLNGRRGNKRLKMWDLRQKKKHHYQ